MALVNASLQLATYTDDFGNTYSNVSFKIGDAINAAVVTTMGYTTRAAGIVCGGGIPFDLRHLRATFSDGTIHQLPVASRSDLANLIGQLKGLTGAAAPICIDLVGEKWNLLTPSVYGNANFKTTPYENIPSSGKKTTYRFTYNSDVLSGTVQLSTAIEIAPTELNTCQQAGLGTVETGTGICSAASIGIQGRKYIIQALAKKSAETEANRRVVRQVLVAAEGATEIKAVIANIDQCAYCLGYKGETIANAHNLVAAIAQQ